MLHSLPRRVRTLVTVLFAFILIAASSSAQTYYWDPVYKLRNGDTLTAADFPGPGGPAELAYPNWYYAGIPGGIPAQHPRYNNVLQLSGFPGYDNTGATDQWAVIMRGIAELHAQGGGVLQLGAGTFLLRESVIITHDNIVIRGAGRDATRIDYRPGIVNSSGELIKGIKWLYLKDGDTVPHDYLIQVRATQTSDRWVNDAAFNHIRIYVNGVQRASTGTDRQGGPNLVSLRASDGNSGISPGQTVALYGEVDYGGGEIYRTPTINVTFAEALPDGQKRLTPAYAAFSFAGDEWSRRGDQHTFNLTADAPRGATTLQVDGSNAANFALIKPGDIIRLEKPTHGSTFLTERATTTNAGTRYLLTVVGTSGGNTIQVAEPLREAFPVAHSSRVKTETIPIRNVGVEDLWIDQSAQQMWTSGIHFLRAYQSWATNVRVTKIGRFPIWPSNSKNIEIRDVVLDEAWYRLGGGTAYIGFGESNDSLIDGVQGSRLRHGPDFGSYASGNVVRNGIFDGMDAHVGHNAWVAENLIELSTVDARQPEDLPAGFGTSYGAAVTAEARDGPQGPRNTFYNNILLSDPRGSFDRSGLDTSGAMEAFYFVANKIYSVGPTVYGARRDIDLVFEDNVLIIQRADAGVAYMPQENAGWEFRDNTIYGGGGQLLSPGSAGSVAVNAGNTFLPFDPNWEAIADPAPATPSLFQFQLDTKYPAVPATPSSVSATAGYRSFTVQWNASANAAAYIVRWGTSAGNYTFSSSGHVARTATITGLQNGQTYYVTVAAVNHRGVSGNASAVTVTPAQGAIAATPTNLTATAVSTSQINLGWTDGAGNETGYVVQRRNGEFGPWATVATLGANTTTFSNTGLRPNQQLFYRVLARNGAGDSTPSNVASATTVNAAPGAVTLLNATASTGRVLLTWSAVYNATGYTLQRATVSGGPYTNLQTNYAGDRYTDTTVTNGTTYYYRLIATNAVGSAPPSAEISAVPNAAPVVSITSPAAGTTITGPATLNIAVNASDADGGITQVQIYNGTTLLTTDTSAPYTHTWSNVAPGTYLIRAVATDSIGVTSETSRYIQLVDGNAPVAAPLLTEPFAYTAGVGPATPGVTMDGGTGLRGAWGGGSSTLVGSGSLTFTDTLGLRSVGGTGNHLASTASEWITGRSTARDPNNATNPLYPWFTSTAGVMGNPGTVFWLSYLVRFDEAPGVAALRASGGTSGTELFFGPYTLTGGQFAIQAGQSPGSPVKSTGLTPQLGQTYLVVVKFEFNGGGRDAVRMWVNPRTDGAVPSDGAVATLTAADMPTGGLDASFQSFSFRGNPLYAVDELRGGAAFRDVVPGSSTNVPPIITIDSPEPATTFAAPASLTITTQAGGSISQVQFYNGATLLGSDSTAPYSYTWNNVGAGTYTVRAVASGPLGTAEASRTVQVVNPNAAAQAPVIYDGFDYPAGTDGTAMIGAGLRSAWGGTPDITEAGAGGLTYYDPLSGLQLQQVGNRLISSSSNWVSGAFTNRDSVGSPLEPWFTSTNGVIGRDDTSIWVSYLLRFDSAPGTAALRLHSPGTELFFGVYTASSGAQLGIQNGQSNATFTSTGLAAQTGETYLIVLKYEFGAGNTDRVRMWVNPRLDRAVPESPYTAVITDIDASWQQLTFRGSANYSVDEFRAGAAFVDVVPNIDLGQPPTVTLTSPAPGALLAAPGSVTLAASTTNTVTRVEFYQGDTLLGQDTTAPYTHTWTNIPAGDYLVRAVVVGPAGTAESSGRITVIDTSAPAQPALLHEPFAYPAGTLGVDMTGGTALRNAWGGSVNALAAAGSLSYTDTSAGLALVTSDNRFTSNSGEWSSGKATQNAPNDATNPLFPWFASAGQIGKDNTSFWVSFLLRFDATPGWAGVRLHNPGSPNELFFGAYSLSGGQLGIQNGQSPGAPFTSTGIAAQANQTYLIVLHFQYGGGGNDAVTMWVNPSLGQGLPASSASATMAGLDLTWQNLTMRGSVAYAVDEIRGGASFRDVVPTTTVGGGGNTAPTITQAASATPSVVSGTSTTLSVRANDNAGESTLTYTWATTSAPAGAPAPILGTNGNNGAKDTTATFGAVGSYGFEVTVNDGSLSTTSAVNVTVEPTATTVAVTPGQASVQLGGTQAFSASVSDQFGAPFAAPVSWSRTGSAGGSISSTGLYTASATTTGTDTVTATSGAAAGAATVTVSAAPTPTGNPIVYEDFNYTAGTLGTAMTGGLHLRTDSTWGGGANTVATTGSLAYTDAASGLDLLTSGNRLASNAWEWAGSRLIVRSPDDETNPLWPWRESYGVLGRDGTTLWLSFLLRFEATPGVAALRTTAGGAAELFFGSYTSAGGNGALGIQVGQTGGTFTPAGLNAVAGTTYLLVVRYDFGAANSDTVTLWVNPELGGASPVSNYTATISGVNASWGGLTFRGGVAFAGDEVRVGASYADVVPTNAPPAQPEDILPVGAVASVEQSGNGAANSIDENFSTRWAGEGLGQFIVYDLGAEAALTAVKLAWFNGDNRQYTFDVEVGDGTNWTLVLDDAVSSGTTTALETYAFGAVTGTHVRVTGRGNTSAFPTWTSIFEARAHGVLTGNGSGGGNTAPVITSAAAASPSVVTGTATALSVAATDDGGESALTYTWATSNAPAGAPAPTFSANGTNSAKGTTATFARAGAYTLGLTVSDGSLSTTGSVSVTVNATPTTVAVSPGTVSLSPGGTQQFGATVTDQFAQAINSPSVTWSRSGAAGGTVSGGGLYTAPAAGSGTDTVTATSGAATGNATVVIGNAAPEAVDDAASTTEGVAVTINVLANDSDPDSGPSALSIQSVGAASFGDTAIVGGQISYTPDNGFYGSDSFAYTITDGQAIDTANVVVTVTGDTAAQSLTSVGLTGTNVGGASGSSRVLTNGQWEITGAGAGFAAGGDAFHMETGARTGDFTVTVRVRQHDPLPGLAPLAGLMVRDGTGAVTRFAAIGVEPSGLVRWNFRVTTSVGGNSANRGTTDVWLRIRRVGTRLYTFDSLDGTTWTQRSNNNFGTALGGTLEVGLFGFGGDASTATLARFSDYGVTNP